MEPPNINKRKKILDSDSEFIDEYWPRFLMIEGTDDSNPFSKLSPFAVNKGIVGITSQTAIIKKLRSGQFLVEVKHKSHSYNLLKTTMIGYTPVKVSAHKTLNTKKE